MNPDVTPDNHFNLPPPVAESPVSAEHDSLPETAEQLMVGSPEAAGNQPGTAAPVLTPQTAMQAVAASQPTPQGATTQAQVSDDDQNPMLDKVWVLKAKQIVLQTANDPYEQNKQLAGVKADYLQKRYGKTVKLAE
jgi:hypothetical protein